MKQRALQRTLPIALLLLWVLVSTLMAQTSGGIFSGSSAAGLGSIQDQQQSIRLENTDPGTTTAPPKVLGGGVSSSSDQQVNQEDPQNRTGVQRNGRYVQRDPPEPPAELTQFQRLVAASIGKVLPIYGTNLFSNVPSTFAPVDRIPVTPEYTIGPGDELLIRIWGQVNLDGHFTVDRSGNIYIPQVGSIQVAGTSFAQLTDHLRSQIGRTFRNFDLNVNVGQLRSIQVFIVGNAKRPGSYTISSLSTLVNALFASGGPTPMGSLRHIQVKRTGQIIGTFDMYDLLRRGDTSKDVRLLAGDVIYIPPVGQMIALAGSVNTPALYEIEEHTTLKEALELAGNLSTMARNSSVRIERIGQQDGRSVLDVDLNSASGLSTSLTNGDLVLITPIIDRFKDAVTLRGNVADPRRFNWFPGMHIRDLIPEKDALLTRDYWQRRNSLGLPVLDSTPEVRRYAPDAPVAQYYGYGLNPAKSLPLFGPTDTSGNYTVPDSDTNVYGKRVPFGALATPSGVENTSLGNAQQTNDNAQRLAQQTSTNSSAYRGLDATSDNLQNGVLASQSEIASGMDASSASSVSAAVTGASRRFPPKNAVVLHAPDVNWAYAVIQRLNPRDLTTQLIPFNLGKAVVDGDPTQNLALEKGDIVTIFSKADIRVPQSQQTKYVRLEGEFVAAGTYSVQPGETLRTLVARVGGLSSDAYLYGSQFNRESTRVIQQQRLNEYAAELDRRIKLAEANSVNNALNPQDEVANIGGLKNARVVAMQLRQLRASGRIVLGIKPDARAVADIPEISLEDGDTFIVPQIPSSVDVFGSVYTQNSFLYDSRLRAGTYLRKAGGGTRTADMGRSFIVHADGSVVSHQYSSLFGNFSSIRLYPGDAIVVPERVDKRPFLRNLVDVATIVGQFGLGIAAVNVLR